jgi:hypothetical protein
MTGSTGKKPKAWRNDWAILPRSRDNAFLGGLSGDLPQLTEKVDLVLMFSSPHYPTHSGFRSHSSTFKSCSLQLRSLRYTIEKYTEQGMMWECLFESVVAKIASTHFYEGYHEKDMPLFSSYWTRVAFSGNGSDGRDGAAVMVCRPVQHDHGRGIVGDSSVGSSNSPRSGASHASGRPWTWRIQPLE